MLDAVITFGRMGILKLGLKRLGRKRGEIMESGVEEVGKILRERGGEGVDFVRGALGWEVGEGRCREMERELELIMLEEQGECGGVGGSALITRVLEDDISKKSIHFLITATPNLDERERSAMQILLSLL